MKLLLIRHAPAVRNGSVGIAVTARMDTTTAGHDDDSHPAVFYDWLRQIEALAGTHSNGTVGPVGIGGTSPLPIFAVIESA